MAQAQPALKTTSQVKDRTRNGGRSLNAIWMSENLTTNEKVILNALASDQDVRGDFQDFRYMALSRFERLTSLSRRTIIRTLNELVGRGYLQKRLTVVKGVKQPTYFRITDRIFEEYGDRLPERGSATETPRGSATEAPKLIQEQGTNSPNKFSTPSGAQKVVSLDKARERKTSTREKARSIVVSLIEIRPGVFIPHKAIDRTADRLLDQFGIKPFYELERRVAVAGKMGKLPWDPNALEYELACIAEGIG